MEESCESFEGVYNDNANADIDSVAMKPGSLLTLVGVDTESS